MHVAHAHFHSLLLQATPDNGLTLREVIRSFPSDPASLVALALIAAFVGGIVYFGLRSGGEAEEDPPASSSAPRRSRGDTARRG